MAQNACEIHKELIKVKKKKKGEGERDSNSEENFQNCLKSVFLPVHIFLFFI